MTADTRGNLHVPDGILPWTKSCFVCGESNPRGFRLHSRVEGGLVVLEYTTRDSDRGWMHIVHGGLCMTLLDEVMTWAAILARKQACVAAEMTTRLQRPVEVGQRVRAEAQVSASKSRLVLTSATLTDLEGARLASATGKYVPMPDGDVELCEKDFVPSPEALPLAKLLTPDS